MKNEWMITLLTAGGILILCAAMIIWDKIRQRKWFLRHLKQRWGIIPDREYTQEELESISHYARRHEGEPFMIDDITWNDLQMDEIFIRMNNTLSSCGEDVLYQMLRQPQMHREVLEERERLIAYFQTHEEERIQVLTRVKEVKKIWNESIIEKKTDKTITDFSQMQEVLEEVRQNGYALDDEENEKGVRCIAACLHGYQKEVKYAFSISGPTSRMTRERVKELAVDVKKVQEELSRELGYYKS